MTAAKKPAPKKKTAGKKAAPVKRQPKKAGRPSAYTEAIAAEICERLANQESLRQICASEGMPHRSTVDRWADDNPDFAARRARAREAQADSIFDDMADIEDRTLKGRIGAAVARAVLSSKQWRASKLAPKKYGDKLALGGASDLDQLTLVINKDLTGRKD